MSTKKWADIRARRKFSPADEAEIASGKAEMRREMLLADLRKARGLTQETLAETMDVPQGEVSKIEHRTDLYLTTLRRFIQAMHGELVLIARFPDGDVPLKLHDDDEEQEQQENHQPRRRQAVTAS